MLRKKKNQVEIDSPSKGTLFLHLTDLNLSLKTLELQETVYLPFYLHFLQSVQ